MENAYRRTKTGLLKKYIYSQSLGNDKNTQCKILNYTIGYANCTYKKAVIMIADTKLRFHYQLHQVLARITALSFFVSWITSHRNVETYQVEPVHHPYKSYPTIKHMQTFLVSFQINFPTQDMIQNYLCISVTYAIYSIP